MKNGSLGKTLRKDEKIRGTKRYLILLGIVIGMKYLHSKGFIHRDMKSDNILIDEKLLQKICDFGCAFISDKNLSEIQIDEYLGTLKYIAPEILSFEPYSYKVDVYAFSLIMYELLTGKAPFKNINTKFKFVKDIKNVVRPDLTLI